MLLSRRAAYAVPRFQVIASRSIVQYATRRPATSSSSSSASQPATNGTPQSPKPSTSSAAATEGATSPASSASEPSSSAPPAPEFPSSAYSQLRPGGVPPSWGQASAAIDEAASRGPVIKDTDWTRSFYGASCKPVTEGQHKILARPVDVADVEVKPDGIVYLPEIKYRRRMNEAFGPMGWSLIPRGEPVVGDNIVTREYALIVDGRFVSQSQGENNYFGADQLPSAVEGCKSNALMRCCKDLGIASELWDPTFLSAFKKNHMAEVWVEHVTTKKKRTLWYRKGKVEVAYPYKVAAGTKT